MSIPRQGQVSVVRERERRRGEAPIPVAASSGRRGIPAELSQFPVECYQCETINATLIGGVSYMLRVLFREKSIRFFVFSHGKVTLL